MMQYPLNWPVGLPRTKLPQRSRFDISEAGARGGLLNELRLMGASQVVITTNKEYRSNGVPYGGQQITDHGVSVYFARKGRQQCIACDKWDSMKDNLQAVRKTVEALRGIERWGTGEMVDAAFRGFDALPAQATAGDAWSKPWYEVLGVAPDAPFEVIEAAYRALRRKAHPDAGGSDEAFNRVEQAFREATR